MDRKGLRLSSDRGSLIGPDEGFIRDLTASEQAGVSLADTFQPGWDAAEGSVDEWLYTGEKYRKEDEHLVAWWKSASYEERVAAVKRCYVLYPLSTNSMPAEDVAKIADIRSHSLVRLLAWSEARARGYWQIGEAWLTPSATIPTGLTGSVGYLLAALLILASMKLLF